MAGRRTTGTGVLVDRGGRELPVQADFAAARVALPGSQSMNAHNDQSTLHPEPWNDLWCLNVIWCLDDVDEGNGATRYLPGSHRIRWRSELPVDPAAAGAAGGGDGAAAGGGKAKPDPGPEEEKPSW